MRRQKRLRTRDSKKKIFHGRIESEKEKDQEGGRVW